MAFHILKVYFRAGVLVPFYLSIAVALMFLLPTLYFLDFNYEAFSNHLLVGKALKIPFFSGLIGLFTLSAFLNLSPKVANHFLFSLLSWTVLPYSFIIWLLRTQVDWHAMSEPGSAEMMMGSVLIIICFFHVIGVIISYVDFRATIVRNLQEQKAS